MYLYIIKLIKYVNQAFIFMVKGCRHVGLSHPAAPGHRAPTRGHEGEGGGGLAAVDGGGEGHGVLVGDRRELGT